ncbi:interleukin-17 receptor C isoform X2 [Genypterus blacodes]|uniref:interleukin-17 receptor C isoform X2 n=1 Tax=Genypterus blacodes TaxID=154954 RepID=UPI003F76D04E
MAVTDLWVPQLPLLLSLLWPLVLPAKTLEMTDRRAPQFSCSLSLTECNVTSDSIFSAAIPDPEETMDVMHVELKVILCCSDRKDCEPCLRIIMTIQVEDPNDTPEESGEEEDMSATKQLSEGSSQYVLPEPTGLVKVCLSFPGSIERCKALQFRPRYSLQEQQPAHELLLTEKVEFGSPVVVIVYAHTVKMHNITIPSLEEVCSLNLDGTVTECDAPKLRTVTDHKRNAVVLQLDNTDTNKEVLMCQMFWNEMPGRFVDWPRGQREKNISLNSVAPCLCFQVWWKGKSLRRIYCPFKNQQEVLERMQHNVSVSMKEVQEREGSTVLSWNVTAPCRLEAEVWLCQKKDAVGQCEEVTGSRQRLHNHVHADRRAPRHKHRTGEFNVSSHPLLCVQMKVHGMLSYLEPHCPFTISRWRWSLPILIGLLLMSLAVLGAYFVQGVLRGYMWRWLKEEDVKGAVGGGHVLLLYQPDGDQVLSGLLCRLGTSLQALGFSVSLDLWSQAELGALGPVPWLHSRLDRLKRQGGKVVLVLTKAAWTKAQEWGNQSWERYSFADRNRDIEEERAEKPCSASPKCVDVFSASLSCILADYLQGRAGERFMLVQFESLPPEPPGGCRALPELFRGLHVYSLPSQSLGFLTELAGARQMATASARRRRAGGIRMASRALARGLSGFTAGSTVLRLAGMSQDCVRIGEEDSWENVPLQPSLCTPPSSPDINPRVNAMDWV